MTLEVIARLHSPLGAKFGVPRQSGLVDSLEGTVVFEPLFRSPEALRGLEGFSHLWLIWGFSQVEATGWSPTVRPPRLGGNTRVGVFATRSPYRPNPIGLSAVRLTAVDTDSAAGPVLRVQGADLMDGTPIYDIKPYLPYADCHPEASGGFAATAPPPRLRVCIPQSLLARLPAPLRAALADILALDPRPAYQRDPERVYGMAFGGFNVRFRVEGDVLIVVEIAAL